MPTTIEQVIVTYATYSEIARHYRDMINSRNGSRDEKILGAAADEVDFLYRRYLETSANYKKEQGK